MFGVERRSKILSLLDEKKSLVIQDVSTLFNVTEETIRRDLKLLESQGLLSRTHGGAVLTDETKTEFPIEIREVLNISGKDAIGRKASEMINNGDTIILDASTSALYVAKHIKNKKGLTVITNAERIILELSTCNDITLICSGGIWRKRSLSYVGRLAENSINKYYASKLFFSCKGFSQKRGFTDSNEQESDVRKTMINCSEQVIFLCDHTKLDMVGYVTTATADEVNTIITDVELSDDWKEYIDTTSINVELALL